MAENDGEASLDLREIQREVYRSQWLNVLLKKLEVLSDTRTDFGKRCNLVRQIYIEIGDIILPAATRRRQITLSYINIFAI